MGGFPKKYGGPEKYRPIMGDPYLPLAGAVSLFVSVSICPYSYHLMTLSVTKSLKWSKMVKYGPPSAVHHIREF